MWDYITTVYDHKNSWHVWEKSLGMKMWPKSPFELRYCMTLADPKVNPCAAIAPKGPQGSWCREGLIKNLDAAGVKHPDFN